MLDGDEPIFKINSIYCLKSKLSYLEYNTVLKLVKYNKSFQKRIDINIKDYSLDYDLIKKKIEFTDIYDIYLEDKKNVISLNYFNSFLVIFLHLYRFVYAIYYLVEKPYKYKEKIVKIEKYFQEYFGKSKIYHKIKVLEICLLIYNILVLFMFCSLISSFRRETVAVKIL